MRKHIVGFLSLLALSTVSDAALYEAGPSGRGKDSDSKPLFAHKGRHGFIDQISESTYAGMHSIRACGGKYVDSIQLTVRLKNGSKKTFARHGGRGGSCKTLQFSSDEYITQIYGEHKDNINYLVIDTNKGDRLAVGRPGPNDLRADRRGISEFRYKSEKGLKIASFHGRSDSKLLRALGVVYQNTSAISGNVFIPAGPSGMGDEVDIRVSNVRPIGGGRVQYKRHELPRTSWLFFPNISTNRSIKVCSGKYIDAIGIDYRINGKKVSRIWGGRGGKCRSVALSNSEYITEISGKHGNVLDSLTIKSNSRVLFSNVGGRGGSSVFRYTGGKNLPIKGFYVRGTRPYEFDTKTGRDSSKRAKGVLYGIGAIY